MCNAAPSARHPLEDPPEGGRLPIPARAALDLHLDRYAWAFDLDAIQHPVHPVDHRLLEPGLDLFCVSLVALDDDLVVHGEDGQRAQALVPTLVEEREGELQSVRPVPCTGELSLLRSLYL